MVKNFLPDPGLISRLESYRLIRQRPVAGGYAGGRRSPVKGGAVEFADYREYAPGDEPRRVDWKTYARLGRLYVKEFLDERQDSVLFVVDTSASMDWGEGETHKGSYALQLAAALGVCVVYGNDRLSSVAGSLDQLAGNSQARRVSYPCSGRDSLPVFWNWLSETQFSGGTALKECLQTGIAAVPGATSLLVFSDLLDPPGVEEMLRLAAGRGMVCTLLHILAPGELEPPGEGEWTMQDMESGERVEVSLTPAALRAYRERLDEFFKKLDDSCRRWGVRRVSISSGKPLAETLFRHLPLNGILSKGT
ncbi:Protein of unknown function DUF58 [Desulfotomaculum arcticum]|uniref:DUF58 domain-containing protein n=1 Tax=Desulfotruncus arcticus DSM 17038 TaxID=1121424 RepID=A0A1I2ST08_9FIRM|nr:DUF58 domain-containing protein [Desulfotruncus arcticus]SFG55862.1 Protein of unknown function DUF58 [Desulfotomaculum arcticum] [Desulfotruncus arcticus DSM 17038]